MDRPIYLLRAISCACLLAAADAQAQTRASKEEQLINWYYAGTFGTGVYHAGDRTVSVLQIPFAYEQRPVSEDRYGLKFRLPVSFGFYDFRFDELLDGTTPHSVSTGSVLPGVEWTMPLTSIWTVVPYASAGYGWEWSGSDSAWIYAVGIKSRVSLPIGHDSTLIFGNQLTHSGYRSAHGSNQPLGLFVVGLNLEIPTRWRRFDRPTRIGYHANYFYYFSRLRFPTGDNIDNKISEEGELAVSLSTTKPVSFKLFDVDRVGLAFRVGGGIQAVRLFLSLPY